MVDQEILADFLAEAREHLEVIEPKLVELENNAENLSIVDDIFRPIHSLKGASGFLNFNKINKLAHKAENVLDVLRKGQLRNSPEIMDLILSSTDALNQMLNNLEQNGEEGDVEIQSLISGLENIIQEGDKGVEGSQPDESTEKAEETGPNPETPPKQDTPEEVSNNSGLENNTATNPSQEAYKLSVISPEHLSDFLEEATEIVSNLNSALLGLEKSSPEDTDLLDDVFRYFHNLKGNSGLIGYKELNEVTHAAETLLNHYRNIEQIPESSVIDVLLKVVDFLEELINAIDQETSSVIPLDTADILNKLTSLGLEEALPVEEGKDQGGTGPAPGEAASGQEEIQEEEIDPEDFKIFQQTMEQQFDNIFLAINTLNKDTSQQDYIDGLYRSFLSIQNASSYMEFEELRTYAETTANLVDQGRNSEQGFGLLLPILEQEAEILQNMVTKEINRIKGVPQEKATTASQESKPEDREETFQGEQNQEEPATEQAVEPREKEAEATEEIQVPEAKDPEPGKAQPEASTQQAAQNGDKQKASQSQPQQSQQSKSSTTIRVEHEKLDHLMNLIGELIINRNQFSLLAKELENIKQVGNIAQNLTETTDTMARISDDLQDTIMQVRMVQVKTVFSRFPRLVRDLSRKSGKKVELITEGEDTELDKSVIEAIGDPLVHLIRNSVDHGLEHGEERLNAGKSETGHLWLRASHAGNSVIIEVEDDGNGMDPEKIKARSIEKEIISQEESEKLDDREAIELIFAPGFSTAEEVSDVSGRGVGMDVVKDNIKDLNGSVAIESEMGKGTKITVTLPLTLAIIEALLVKVRGDTYAIPLDAVSETTKISSDNVSEVNKREATTLRGEVLGVVELAEILGRPPLDQKRDILPLVVISVNNRRLGLVVDQLLQRQEIVIKSMGEYLGSIQGLSGATIMGDGSVILILDPSEIMRQMTNKA